MVALPRCQGTMRFRSTAKVLAKCQLKYHRISTCKLPCALERSRRFCLIMAHAESIQDNKTCSGFNKAMLVHYLSQMLHRQWRGTGRRADGFYHWPAALQMLGKATLILSLMMTGHE